MGQAADEFAFFQAGNQAVDARFRFQAQRFLHFVERGRHPLRAEMLVNEEQELVLFACQHRDFVSLGPQPTRCRTKQKRRYMF